MGCGTSLPEAKCMQMEQTNIITSQTQRMDVPKTSVETDALGTLVVLSRTIIAAGSAANLASPAFTEALAAITVLQAHLQAAAASRLDTPISVDATSANASLKSLGKNVVPEGQSFPLVRYSGEEIRVEHLPTLRALVKPVRVVAFSGAGRSGKSTTASAVVGFPAFKVGHTQEAVTIGIDAAWRHHPAGGTVLVLDCEGAYNPMFPGRAQEISALVLLVASRVLHVEFGSIDERHLEAIAALAAGRALLCSATREVHGCRNLAVLVNGSRFSYSADALESILATESDNAETIVAAFSSRTFFHLPHLSADTYKKSLDVFVSTILSEVMPYQQDGEEVEGAVLAAVLSKAASAIQKCGVVKRGSVVNQMVAVHAANQARLLTASFATSLAARHDPQAMAKELQYQEGDIRIRLNQEYEKIAVQLRDNLHREFDGAHESEIQDAVSGAERLLRDSLQDAWTTRQELVKKDLESYYTKVISGQLPLEGWEVYDTFFHRIKAKVGTGGNDCRFQG